MTVDPSHAADVAAAIADIDTVCRQFADRLDELRVADTVPAALVIPAAQFARLPSEVPDQAGNWAFPSGGACRPLTPEEVGAAVDRAQQQLRGIAALLPHWQIETEVDIRAGKSRGDTDTPKKALARVDARMDQIRDGVSILRTPFPGLNLPVGDDVYVDVGWADDYYDDRSPAVMHLGAALMALAMGNPRGAMAEVRKARMRLA
ncbi:hypothetical protein ACIOGZ_28370 [Kitasatospora sp. NPDC088160]|uniref:hypothetical protein n=1 Tax=Kitasatospora sp. NPDC088160 TaxID=3364072 RepID=UPI00380EF315